MSSAKVEPEISDDDRFTFIPGLGRTRTGPRGRQYWDSRVMSSSPHLDSYRPDYTRWDREPPPGFLHRSWTVKNFRDTAHGWRGAQQDISQITNSQSTARDGSVERISVRSSTGTADSLAVEQESFAHTLSRMFAEAQQRRIGGEEDDRRESRNQRQHPDGTRSDSEDGRFFRDASTASATPQELVGSDVGSFHDDVASDSTTDSSPAPPPVPPIARLRLPGACTCPVEKACPAREDHLIDCRTLVIEWRKWNRRQVEEEAEPIPVDVEAEDEEFVHVNIIASIVRLLADVNQHAANTNGLRATFVSIKRWLQVMTTTSIQEDDLNASNALPAIQHFLSEENARNRAAKNVPIAIIEDLTILQRKWEWGDFSQLPRRGLLRRGNMFVVDHDWPWRRPDSKYFGHGHLVNGQKWNRRAEMCRDGAHGPPIAGISGSSSKGAYSVVMGYHDTYKQDFYADIDCGNRIFYLSTALPDLNVDANGLPLEPSNYKDLPDLANIGSEHATHAAQALIKSVETGNPVRVFRSFKASKICPQRPKKGFRYDGLYEVVDYECLKVKRQIYRFEMIRLDHGQGPIRSGVPAEPISTVDRVQARRAARARRVAAERVERRGRRR